MACCSKSASHKIWTCFKRCACAFKGANAQSLDLLITACNDLRDAKLFRELLAIILMMGNYLNGTNYAGGAFGFKIASINRVSRTCSVI